MPAKKKTENTVATEVATSTTASKEETLRGRAAFKHIFTWFGVKLGKKPQKKSKVCNPKSPSYNPIVAKNRKKEKARRHHNAVMRARAR